MRSAGSRSRPSGALRAPNPPNGRCSLGQPTRPGSGRRAPATRLESIQTPSGPQPWWGDGKNNPQSTGKGWDWQRGESRRARACRPRERTRGAPASASPPSRPTLTGRRFPGHPWREDKASSSPTSAASEEPLPIRISRAAAVVVTSVGQASGHWRRWQSD